MRKKFGVVVALLLIFSIPAMARYDNEIMHGNNVAERSSESIDIYDFGIIAHLEIDGKNEGNECSVKMLREFLYINNYKAGTPIRIKATYKIVNDLMGCWDEAPYDIPPVGHNTTIEKWKFIMKAEINGYEYAVESTKHIEKDCPWDEPPEQLMVLANSSVVEGEVFSVKILYHGYPTYQYWGDPEKVTFNNVTKTANATTGVVEFTAPMVDRDTIFTIRAVKNWNNSDAHHPSEEDVYTYGETKIIVLNSPTDHDLVVIAPSTVMERKDFRVKVLAGNEAVENARVEFNGHVYETGSDGTVIINAPEVEQNEEFFIIATASGFKEGKTIVTVLSDYDDEADTTDESGKTGNLTLEFSIPRWQFYRHLPSPGSQQPLIVDLTLSCIYYVWEYKGYPHWGEVSYGVGSGRLEILCENKPPEIISFTGKTKGRAGVAYEYTVHAVDPDNDPIHLFDFFWGDGRFDTDNNNSRGFPPDAIVKKKHRWKAKGVYTIEVYVEDALGDRSYASLEVEIKRRGLTGKQDIPFYVLKILDKLGISKVRWMYIFIEIIKRCMMIKDGFSS